MIQEAAELEGGLRGGANVHSKRNDTQTDKADKVAKKSCRWATSNFALNMLQKNVHIFMTVLVLALQSTHNDQTHTHTHTHTHTQTI